MGALLSRVSRCADRPFPGLWQFEPAPRFLPGELGDVQGLVLPASEGLQGDTPIVEEILKPEYDCLFGPACADLRKSEVQMMLETVYDYIANYFRPMRDQVAGCEVASPVSPVLIAKSLMGTLGCVPAYDRFFVDGIKKYKVTTQEYSLESVLTLAEFYEEHNDRLEEARQGFEGDGLTYPQMKLLDMGFWQIGFETS